MIRVRRRPRRRIKEEKKLAEKKGQQRDDFVKVALIYFLEGILLNADVKKNFLD